MTTLSRAIIQTLAYSDYFGYPLTRDEIYPRLIKCTCTRGELKHALEQCVRTGQIEAHKEYLFLPGKKSVVANRARGMRQAAGLRGKAERVARLLSYFPWVRAVYLTGSVAVGNSHQGDDIDVMIVAENQRLWMCRAVITIYTTLSGMRRKPRSKTYAGKVCLNLYLTPRAYKLPVYKQSIYTAYELIQAVPLYDPDNTRDALLASNRWINKFLPNFYLPPTTKQRDNKLTKNQSDTLARLERAFFRAQLWHMKNKITDEYITSDCAFFHPQNPESKILKKIGS